jgi:hypothetical protein
MRVKHLFYFLLISIFFSFFSCQDSKWEVPKDALQNIKMEWKRFDHELIKLSGNELTKAKLNELEIEFPHFAPLYVEGIMRFGGYGSNESIRIFNQFLNDQDVISLLRKVENTFPENDFEMEKQELAKGFARYSYHFQGRPIPEVFCFASAFTFTTVVDDSLLGIGLDMYLGKEYKPYAQAGIPKYKFKHFERSYIVPDALRAWLVSEFQPTGGQNLLEQMIYQGKIAYLLSAFLPSYDEHLLINYTEQELDWCEANEKEIWFHFVDLELLHTIENFQLRKYMGEAPFIAGFPEGSPGRVGQWMGFQIVKAYLDAQPNESLIDLMNTENADLILQQSNYKPKR